MRDQHHWGQHLLAALLVIGVSGGLDARMPMTADAAALVAPRARPRLHAAGAGPIVDLGLASTAAVSATWSQQAELTSTAQSGSDCFACTVALSGNTALIGAPYTPFPNDYGAAYIFVRSGSTWSQQTALTDPVGQPSDMFGHAVALSGNTAAIGAYTPAGGVVYIYARSGTTWTLQATLTPSDAVYTDAFGYSLVISGTSLIVGAPGINSSAGAFYVFERSGSTWTQQAEVLNPDGTPYVGFGSAVALSGNTVVSTEQYGRLAYVYVGEGSTWAEQAVLAAPPQANGQYFGIAAALWGNAALVSACCATSRVPATVFVYGRTGTTWTQQATISPPAGASREEFGISVGLSGHTAVIGGGPTYVYVGHGSTWHKQAELIPSDVPASGPGIAVAVQGNTVVAGATSYAAYVFVRTYG